jgi:TonB family protein
MSDENVRRNIARYLTVASIAFAFTTARAQTPRATQATDSTSRTYFEFQVSKPVTIVPGNVPPTYPSSLRDARISGEVLAQFVVDTLGHADMSTFRVLKSTDSLFAQAVYAALPRYQFTPAELGGRNVRQLVQMPFQFSVTPPAPQAVPARPPRFRRAP